MSAAELPNALIIGWRKPQRRTAQAPPADPTLTLGTILGRRHRQDEGGQIPPWSMRLCTTGLAARSGALAADNR